MGFLVCRRLVASVVLLSSWEASGDLLDGLSHINPEKIAHSLGDVNPSKVAEALQDAKIPDSVKAITPDKIPDSVKAITPDKAVKAIQSAGTAKVSDVVGVLEAQKKDNSTGIGKASGTIDNTVERTNSLVEALQKQQLPKEVIDKVREADPQKVQKVLSVAGDRLTEAMKHVSPKKVEEALKKDPHKIDQVLEAIETVDWWSTHWQWVFLSFCLTLLTCVGACYVHRTFLGKGPRSPNLLMPSEIDMWARPGGGPQWQPPEEQGFRQF